MSGYHLLEYGVAHRWEATASVALMVPSDGHDFLQLFKERLRLVQVRLSLNNPPWISFPVP